MRSVYERRSFRRDLRAVSLCVGLAWVGLNCQAAVVGGTITGFVPNPFGGGGNYVRTTDVRFTLQRAFVQYEATAFGRAITGRAAIQVAAGAGRAMAMWCLSNPIGAAACATAAIASWLALSKIRTSDDGTSYEKGYETFGPCYHARKDGQTSNNFLGCEATIGAAASTLVTLMNSDGFGDTPGVTECDWSVTSLPGSISQGGTGSAHVKRHCINLLTGNESNTDVLFAIKREVDQATTDYHPATPDDMGKHGDEHPPPDDVTNDYPGPIPTNSPDFEKGTGTAGDPYPGDDTPNEGPWKQDRITTTGRPGTEDPMDLETGTETVSVDNPNTSGLEGDGDPNDPDTPGTNGDAIDICKEHPKISACQELGEPPDDEIPKSTSELQWQWSPLGLPVACPAPIPTPYGDLSFSTACEAAEQMAPLVAACGAIAALMICVAAIRRS